jgi:predicted DNA-binding protein (UPF0251 family)
VTADQTKRAPRTRDCAILFVAALVSLNAAAAFTVQAWFAYGFARHVWTLPLALALAVPAFLDLFVATMMVITYLLRDADAWARRRTWAILFAGIAAQVAMSESFATWSHYGTPGRIASFAPALFLAAILHTLIDVVRHRGQRPAAVPAASREPRAVPQKNKTKQTVTDPPTSTREAEAVRRVLAGESTRTVAASIKVSQRTVQNWVEASRKATGNGHARVREISPAGAPLSDAPVPRDGQA